MVNIRSNFCVTLAFFLNDWERLNITLLYALASTVTAVGGGQETRPVCATEICRLCNFWLDVISFETLDHIVMALRYCFVYCRSLRRCINFGALALK